ncbi:toll/interleukin-1 receptor domain-containing protein [Bacillus cereus]|uniref:toll/interleukin-1 receptor domain-containing protein n=1 Tax=Bacillus cereus TaxID=1396 RepID=UPI0037F94477
MLDVTKIQSIIDKLQIEKYDIHSSLIDVLRIARQRLDIKEILFLEYNNNEFSEVNFKGIPNKIKEFSEKKGISKNDYYKLSVEILELVYETRTCDIFDFATKKILQKQVVIAPVSGLISEVEKYERLLESNTVPPGLHHQDLFIANQRKNQYDAFYNHELLALNNVLNKIKSFMLNYLMELEEISRNTEGNIEMSTQQTLSIDNKIKKIFISHASRDKEYVKALVNLLNSIGVPKKSDSIFCSSLPEYDIPHGEDIYDYLKNELNNNKTMVLFVLSDNYYQSAPCLNEMGAAWITSKKCSSVLTPNFDFKKIEGAIDPTQISFRMNNSNGLDKFRDYIIESLELDAPGYKLWQSDRDDYLNTIKQLSDEIASKPNIEVKLERVRKQDTNLKIDLRFINVTEKDIEFQYIDIELIDAFGEKLHIPIKDDVIEEIRLRSKENKIIEMIVPYDTSAAYQLRQNVTKDAVVDFRIL